MFFVNKIKDLWYMHGFVIMFILTIGFIFSFWFFVTRKHENGSYNEKIDFKQWFNQVVEEEGKPKEKPVKKRGPPTESKGEKECRRVLEMLYRKPFPKARPDFMFNPVTNQNLELDMFNIELKIACEYNGQQHYKFNKWMHRNSHVNFQNQQYRDTVKRDACKKLGIHLIEVPYTIKNENIQNFIISNLRDNKLL